MSKTIRVLQYFITPMLWNKLTLREFIGGQNER